MNYIFRTYPAHPWLPDWIFEPQGCGTTFREKNAGHFFLTRQTVGRIAPNVEAPDWLLQIPVPQNSQTNMLFNGFCAYLKRRKAGFAAEVITPEPGILWGRYEGIPAPVLATDRPIDDTDGFQWMEHEDTPALLAVREGTFCLVTQSRTRDGAVRLAERFLSSDIEKHLQEARDTRAGAVDFFEHMSHHDSLAAICVECMMRALRPAEGDIPMIWSQSPESDTPLQNINELYPLAAAWIHLDPKLAEELVLCVLKQQSNAGAIPVQNSPHGTHSVLEAPKPMIAKTAEMVWDVRKDPDFLAATIPLLRRHLQWLLHHFDPKRRGLHCWQNRGELPIPEIYESELATVDLTVLLLTEIEALNRLRKHSPICADHPSYFETERENLEHNLLDQFWNDAESAFTNAFTRGKTIKVEGIPTFTPLLWKSLPNTYRSAILDRLKEAGTLPGEFDVLSWRTSALDTLAFPLHQQLLTLEALRGGDPHGSLIRDFSRVTLQGFVEQHTLSLEEHQPLRINPVIAAFITNVQSTHQYHYIPTSGLANRGQKLLRKLRADYFDLMVILVTISAALSVHAAYKLLHAPPEFDLLTARMNSAYAERNTDKVFDACRRIIHYYPEQASIARLLAANASQLHNNPETARQLLEDVRKEYPDSPSAMISLGLANQLLGRLEEAEKNYAEFCYLFDEIFPELVAEINQWRYLMREGFRTPPKWREIYSNPIMNEL